MKAELYYFDGCPSYGQALDNLKEALRLEQMPNEVKMISVADVTDAQAKWFIGSPTIRIDGVDVEGPDAATRGYGFGCRVYTDGGPRWDGRPWTRFVRRSSGSAAGEKRKRDPAIV